MCFGRLQTGMSPIKGASLSLRCSPRGATAPSRQILVRSWHSLVPTQTRPCKGTWCHTSSFRDRVKYKDSH